MSVQCHQVVVHTIKVSDVEDPDLFVAEPIWQWQQTEAGQYIMSHAVETPTWVSNFSETGFAYIYQIVARLREPDLVFWRLKWGTRE